MPHTCAIFNTVGMSVCLIPYSGYFSGGKIFMRSEFLASSWKNFRSHGILNHTSLHCGTVSWVKISWFASQPRKPRKFYPPKNTCYTVQSYSTLTIIIFNIHICCLDRLIKNQITGAQNKRKEFFQFINIIVNYVNVNTFRVPICRP